ncbi:hypothetical protein [Dyadobacter sp. CY312]|uniref:hypothetical protein n=1 Tax=Dyadobacter sp. CY312 TaxID=2907303 RepID=UPI001F363D4E|nr:hypothetical protein [Dyadobacter sp. CY312]MCE7041893.1 hypothetical protein [Dyadobacter sp. CY312]
MNKSTTFLMGSAIVAGIMGCSAPETPTPVADNATEVAADSINANAKLLTGPDLTISYFGYPSTPPSIGDGAGGRAFIFKLVESNIGNQSTADLVNDEIKIYQRIPIGAVGGPILGYQYSYVKSFYRNGILKPGASHTFPSVAGGCGCSVWLDRESMSVPGPIELVAVADGAGKINEINETNNTSPVFRIYR